MTDSNLQAPDSRYRAVIGLEVHARMLTDTKAFCGCSSEYGVPANSRTCPVCLGHPGTLPVLNRQLIDCILRLGIAMECRVRHFSGFARKNYLYPDLPKGYQITQFEEPVCSDGFITVDTEDGDSRAIGISRIHIEEDAGKLVHADGEISLVDFNRCGTPLVEIVSKPEIHSAREAHVYLEELRRLLRYLDICDCNMEEGSLRCDANISLQRVDSELRGSRTEIKNLNSFRNVEKALEFEILRQHEILDRGGTVESNTMLWDDFRRQTEVMRVKEEGHEYRYFTEPDLRPVYIDMTWMDEARRSVPELPRSRRDRFTVMYTLPRSAANILTETRGLADYYEDVVKCMSCRTPADRKAASSWVLNEILNVLKKKGAEAADIPLPAERLAELIVMVQGRKISGRMAKHIFTRMLDSGESASTIAEREELYIVAEMDDLVKIAQAVLIQHPREVQQYRKGKLGLLEFFMGEAMKSCGGRADPSVLNRVFLERLAALSAGNTGTGETAET